MAIIRVRKTTLIGLAEDQDRWLPKLQQLGVMHVEPQDTGRSVQDANIGLPEKAQEALRYLLESPHRIKDWQLAEHSINTIIDRVLHNKSQYRAISDQRDNCYTYLKAREDWGDFKLPDVKQLGGYHLWFYLVPSNQLHRLTDCPHPWEMVQQHEARCYVVVLAQEEPTKIEVPFKRTRMGGLANDELRDKIFHLERELDEIELERASLTRWIGVLSSHLNQLLDDAELIKTQAFIRVHNELCYIQGWVPENLLPSVERFADQHQLACMSEPVAAEQQPPTLLKTHPLISGGKAVVEFFQTPGYRTWDPSLMVFISFNLFFAMILSDAGYAAVCGLIVYFYRHKLKAMSLGVFRLMQSLVVSALLWGIFVGSYFGFSPEPGSLPDLIAFVDLNNYQAMITLSVAIGVIHLIVANISAGLARESRWLRLSDWGWALTLFAGFCMFAWDFGLFFLIIGLIMVFVCSSERVVTDVKSFLLRFLDGLKALTGFTKGFGDVLSYMRLFALGLASSQLAITFNGIAMDVKDSMPGLGLLFAILILVLGHVLNFVLAIMGGVIHGLRLNLIEFLNWGVKAEGYPFKPFAKQEDEQWKQ